jgi:LysR family transcriptional regulator, transcriptional activator of nhaA
MAAPLNYGHLYYFWVVAKEGGMARAADRLGMAVQTVSAQVRSLEQSLGHALFKPAGRGMALTEAGRAAMAQADQIFQLGEQLPALVREAATGQGLRLAVGISDGLPKLVVRHLLQPAVDSPDVRLLCHEDEFDRLLGDLALHRLDVVLSDRAAPPNPNLRLYSHPLGQAALAWFAPLPLARRCTSQFPDCLAEMPLLLPTGHAAVRPRLDQWFERHGLRPRIAGEFEDSALLAAFGRSGMGAFPASRWSHEELLNDKRLRLLGETPELVEHFYLISAERRIQHPLVQRLLHTTAEDAQERQGARR